MSITFDIYRGFNPADPYNPPHQPAAFCNVAGDLRHHVRNGRFGYRTGLHWTNVLTVSSRTDIRDGWDTHLKTFAAAAGDTILVKDYPTAGFCTAFLVVHVQKLGGSRRCYLDRAQPRQGVCPPCGTSNAGSSVIVPCCPGTPLPQQLYGTWTSTGFANQPQLPNPIPFAWANDPIQNAWNSPCYQASMDPTNPAWTRITLTCVGTAWRVNPDAGLGTGAPTSQSCSPFQLVFGQMTNPRGFNGTSCGNGTNVNPFGNWLGITITP